MKKFVPVIMGLLIGISTSIYLINEERNVAHGEISIWDEIVAYGDFFDWQDIFTPSSKGTDLYYLVYDKLIIFPEKDALKEVAQKYGLTKEEAQSVIDGSITPIFNMPDRRGAELTIENAYILAENLQNDFAEINETFDIQREVDVAIAPSEIFANGDLSDSGFDLIYDLSVIEEILFVEKTPNTVGDPFGNELASPYLPTEPVQEEEYYVAPEGPAAVSVLSFKESPLTFEEGEEVGDEVIAEGGEGAEEYVPTEAYFMVGDEQIDVDVLDEDICPSEDGFAGTLEEFEEEKAEEEALGITGEAVAVGEEEPLPGEPSEEEVGEGAVTEEGEGEIGVSEFALEEVEEGGLTEEGELEPAPADEWLESWCPALVPAGDTGAAAGAEFGEAGFTSLGDFPSLPILQSTGAGAWVSKEGFSLQIGICLDTKMIKKKVSSYQPGDSCILCEVEKINDYMDKTLSHSLIPNKATGNLMESAKCKKSFQTLMDMQFIAIAAPVPTPTNDDIIFGKNIFEEWKKFVDRYRPLLIPQPERTLEFELQAAPEDSTQLSIIQSLNTVLAQKEGEARLEIENTKSINQGTNTTLFAQTVLGEIRQIKSFFKGYQTQYEKINKELCPSIGSKKDI